MVLRRISPTDRLRQLSGRLVYLDECSRWSPRSHRIRSDREQQLHPGHDRRYQHQLVVSCTRQRADVPGPRHGAHDYDGNRGRDRSRADGPLGRADLDWGAECHCLHESDELQSRPDRIRHGQRNLQRRTGRQCRGELHDCQIIGCHGHGYRYDRNRRYRRVQAATQEAGPAGELSGERRGDAERIDRQREHDVHRELATKKGAATAPLSVAARGCGISAATSER